MNNIQIKKEHILEAVYKLVVSLNKEEKRFFTQYVQQKFQQKHQIYARLYHAFISLKQKPTFDDFENIARDLGIQNLYNAKNILENEILQSLRQLYKQDKEEYIIIEHFKNAELLYDKGLIHQSKFYIEKAEKHALKTEKYWLMSKILSLKNSIYYQLNFEYDENIFLNMDNNLDALKKTLRLKNIFLKCYFIRSKNTQARNNEALKLVEQLTSKINEKEDVKSKNSFILFQQIKAIEAYYKGDLSKEQKYIESALQSMIEVDDYISENTQLFVEQFHRYLLVLRRTDKALFTKKYDEFISLQNSNFIKHKPFIKVLLLTYAYNTKMVFLLENGNFKLALNYYKTEVQKFVEKYKTTIPFHFYIIFLYMEVYVEISCSNYNIAHEKLLTLNKLVNYKIRPDLYIILRIFELLIHTEINNTNLVKYLSASTQKYLKSKQKLYESEKLLISFFHRLPLLNTEKQKNKAFEKLRESIIEINQKNPSEQRFYFYFNFLIWIESKIANKPMIDL